MSGANYWKWNRDYKDHGQVEPFYPAYLAVRDEMTAAGKYPYNDDFKGRVSGIEGPDEDRAIYMLQTLHKIRDMESKVAQLRADGWRDIHPIVEDGAVRFAGIAEYGWYTGGTGFRQWENARLITAGGSTAYVIPGRNRTRGHMVFGKLLVKDA